MCFLLNNEEAGAGDSSHSQFTHSHEMFLSGETFYFHNSDINHILYSVHSGSRDPEHFHFMFTSHSQILYPDSNKSLLHTKNNNRFSMT